MKTLKDVAKIYKDKALQAINPGVPYKGYKTGSSKAYKTGKLFKEVAGRNRIQTMVTEDSRGNITFRLNFQLPDYAKYVHFGTKKNGKTLMKARPFAQIAAQSPEFIKAKDEAMNTKSAELLDDIFADLDKIWKSGGDNLTVKG
jgi:hypothetical protein